MTASQGSSNLPIKPFHPFSHVCTDTSNSIVATPNQGQDTGTMTLFRRQAPHHLCAKLCELTGAAAEVYTLKQDLFEVLVDARNKELKKLAANGAASGAALWSLGGAIATGIEITEAAAVATATGTSAVSTCATTAAAAACWPVAVAASSVMLVTGTGAFFHYKEAKALGKRKICCEKSECSILPTSSSILLWNTTFIGLLIGNPLV